MLSKVTCFALNGLEGVPVEVETDINKGMVSYDLVGLPDAAVKESKERVRSAIKNSAFRFPVNKITINLAPADLKKEGSQYDLSLAVSILKADGTISAQTDDIVFLGELALDGNLRPVAGILPILISARAKGFSKFIVPAGNANEASYIEGAEVYALKSLRDVAGFLSGEEGFQPVSNLAEVRLRYVAGARAKRCQTRAGNSRCGRAQYFACGASRHGQNNACKVPAYHYARYDFRRSA